MKSNAEELRDIGMRLRDMREIRELDAAQMARKLGVSDEEYASYENGERDFQISFLCEAAKILGVDVLDLMKGDSPTLSVCTVVKRGKGYAITRNRAYNYKHLAFPFRNRKIEPFLVTVEPGDTPPPRNSHEGHEFEYMVSGKMTLYIGDMEYELERGDSAYFDSSVPHALRATGKSAAKFIAVVIG